MKGLFSPDRNNNAAASAGDADVDVDVSMDDSNLSGMSVSGASVGTESSSMGLLLGSPPRTQRKTRHSYSHSLLHSQPRSVQGPAFPIDNGPTTNGGGGVHLRSRLFDDDDNGNDHGNNNRNNNNNLAIQHNNNHSPDHTTGSSSLSHSHAHSDRKPPTMILKPLDLNQSFAETADPPTTTSAVATATRGSPLRPGGARHDHNHNTIHYHRPSLTPRPPRRVALALRKRQAEEHGPDLHGNGWGFDAAASRNESGVVDLFPSVDSPVDMYTSPRISPSTPGGSGRSANHHAMSVHRSPFYMKLKNPQQQQQQQLQCHKSPSHFQTLDGRTVQSKNPFSPMIFDSKKPSPRTTMAVASKLLSTVPGNSPAPWKDNGENTTTNTTAATLGLSHPLLLTTDSLSDAAASSQTKPHLVLRSKLQKRGSPCHPLVVDTSGSNTVAGNSNSNSNNTIARNNQPMMGLGMVRSIVSSLLVQGRTPTRKAAHAHAHAHAHHDNQNHTPDRYPEPTRQYPFTGSPIREGVAKTSFAKMSGSSEAFAAGNVNHNHNHNHNHPASPGAPQAPPEDFCTNIHKVRRRSKGDDVVAAAAQGEPTWKKKGLYIRTNPRASARASANPPNHHNNQNQNNSGFYNNTMPVKSFYSQHRISVNPNDDNISPTDVLNFPQFRASPSNTSTAPQAPSKPVRPRPPARRYTLIKNPTEPPRTPMRRGRASRSFGVEDRNNDNDNDNDNDTDGFHINNNDSSDEYAAPIGDHRVHTPRRRRRRPISGEGIGMDYHHLSPGGENPVQPLQVQPPSSRFYSDFDAIAELGNGSFGKVVQALSRLDGCMYAIKIAHRAAKGKADKDRMLQEVYALSALSDQADTATFHIVRYHQAWMDEEQRLYIQTELCTTTLEAKMKEAAPGQLDVPTRFKFLREILLALEFIHKNGMVHLDIKPENIFWKNGLFKLGDFGLVSTVSSHDVDEGDSRYTSMELLSGDSKDLTKSDIYSLGIAVYEICSARTTPLPSNGPEWQALRSGSIVPPMNTPYGLYQIIKRMMNPTYQQRPSASELLKLPDLLSEEQKLLFREREKVLKANQALEAQCKIMKPKGIVRRNTWSSFS